MACASATPSNRDRISVVTGCRDRLAELLRSLPSWIAALPSACEIIIVDWSSRIPVSENPELIQLISSSAVQIRIARVERVTEWSLSQALNFGFSLASGPLLLKVDTDVRLSEGFLERHPLDAANAFFFAGDWRRARSENETHLNGCFFTPLRHVLAIGAFNEHLSGYGWDDSDLYQRLVASGCERRPMDHDFATHTEHEHDASANELILRNMFLAEAMPWTADSWPRRFRPEKNQKSMDVETKSGNNQNSQQAKPRRRWAASGRWSAAPDANKPSDALFSSCVDRARRALLAQNRGMGWMSKINKSSSFLADLLSRRGPKIVIEPKNGLGNRLRALASAAVLAEVERRPLLILWVPDDQCGATLEQLFDTRDLLVFSSVRDLEAATDIRWSACARYTPGRPLRLPEAKVAPIEIGELAQAVLVVCTKSLRLAQVLPTETKVAAIGLFADDEDTKGCEDKKSTGSETKKTSENAKTMLIGESGGGCSPPPTPRSPHCGDKTLMAIRESSGGPPSPPPTPPPHHRPHWWTFDGPLWITSACALQWPGASWARESAWLRALPTTAAITSRADRLLLELGARDCIGLHIRMGQGVAFGYEDASGWEEKQARRLHHFRHASHFSFFLHEVQRSDMRGRPILLCADRPEVVEKFRRALPEDERWRVRIVPPPRGTSVRSCDRSALQVEGALVEAILLSQCYAFFGSPWSSFTELAIRLGARNPKISGDHFARRKFAVFCHRHSVNLGDTMQSLAVMQFIPATPEMDTKSGAPTGRVKATGEPDGYVERDSPSLGLFDAHGVLLSSWSDVRSPHTIVHSGWYDGRLMESEPFPEQLSPLLLSMHINESPLLLRDPKYTDLLTHHGVPGRSLMEHRKEWFLEHAPVGCRDQHTADLLAAQNVRSFVSGCATLLLRRPADVVRTDRVLVVDTHILFPSLLSENHVPSDAEKASMVLRSGLTCAQKLHDARAMLSRFASAKCVVTSRLHAALPSLAMDVPVLFLFNQAELIEDVRFDKRMRTILGLDEKGNQASPWNWDAPSITERQREAISEVQSGLRWRLEHFHSIGI